jgi:mono/diheme cytochrome c family protein
VTLRRLSPLVVAAALAGCRVTPPGPVERAAATLVKHRLTVGGRTVPNPLAASAANLERGRRTFASYCVACHGLDGQATGVPFALAMSPPIPSLAASEVQSYTDGQLKWIVENGLFPSGMPASRGLLSEEEMWRIVVFLRHLPPKGSLGDPPFYGGEAPAAPCASR